MRRRLILTRRIPSIASANNRNALFWNPAGATLEQALAVLGASNGSLGVIGGTDVFGLFLDRYDIFFLTRSF
jgi:dihydrofolate reductase